ncbi:MAG: DUF2142 domain-containing protein [Mycoplasmatales bacterium]
MFVKIFNKVSFIIVMYIIFTFFNLFWLKNNFPNYVDFKIYIYIFMFLVVPILLYLVIYVMKDVAIEKKWLLIFSCISLAYMFIVPYNKNPDEYQHLMRSSEVASGNLLSSNIPESNKIGRIDSVSYADDVYFENYKSYYSNLFTPVKDDLTTYGYANAALYAFTAYGAQAIGMILIKLFNGPILLMIMFGKLSNLAVFIALCYFGLKRIPKYKIFCMSILLFPMTLQLATSLSPDCLIIGLSFFYIATILKIKNDNHMTKRDKIILPIVGFLVAVSKIVYFPILFFILLLPKSVFKNKRERRIFLYLTIALITIINFTWSYYAMKTFMVVPTETPTGVDSNKQLAFVLSNFFLYISYFFYTIYINLEFYITTMVQSDILNGVLKPNLYAYITFIMSFLALFISEKIVFNIREKIVAFCIFSVSIGFIFTSLYIQWTPYMQESISGVQGRYFLPILFLLPIFFFNIKIKKIFLDQDYFHTVAILVNSLYLISYFVFFIGK